MGAVVLYRIDGPASGGVLWKMREAEGRVALRVGAALPDPPFEFMTGAGPTSFDVPRVAEAA
jgi:hypothetical protein